MFPHLDLQIRKQLLNEITNGIYANAKMLPSETELCERLGVSRSTLRQAVTSLEQEHFLRRRQGIGTEIDRNVCSMKGRLDLNPEFSIFLSELGYEPRRKYLDSFLGQADESLASRLDISVGEATLFVKKMWTASGAPAIWCMDMIPVRYIKLPYATEDLDTDIFSFLKSTCNQQISFQIASIEITPLEEEVAAALELPVDELVVLSNCVAYNPKGAPVLASKEIYVSKYLSFTVLRSKI